MEFMPPGYDALLKFEGNGRSHGGMWDGAQGVTASQAKHNQTKLLNMKGARYFATPCKLRLNIAQTRVLQSPCKQFKFKL
jgi:hypothetical protein